MKNILKNNHNYTFKNKTRQFPYYNIWLTNTDEIIKKGRKIVVHVVTSCPVSWIKKI
jgi:hypothetical protein